MAEKANYIAIVKIIMPITANCLDTAKQKTIEFVKERGLIEFACCVNIEPILY